MSGFLGIANGFFSGVAMCSAGIGLLSFSAGYELIWWYRKKHWKFVEGSVTGKVYDCESCYPRISYNRDNKTTEFVSKYPDEFGVVGRSANVYHCRNCMDAEEYDPKKRFVYSILTGAIAVMLIFMGLAELHR